MSRPTTEVHAYLDAIIRATAQAATDADEHAIQRTLGYPTNNHHWDEKTATFLRQARRTVLATTIALSAVLDAHRGQPTRTGETICRECGTVDRPCRTLTRIADTLALYGAHNAAQIDRTEAWHRADRHFNQNAGNAGHALISIEDFGDGYLARQAQIDLPDPPAPPNLDTETTLVVDKSTGELTLWPLLPVAMLADQYRRYLRRSSPMILGDS